MSSCFPFRLGVEFESFVSFAVEETDFGFVFKAEIRQGFGVVCEDPIVVVEVDDEISRFCTVGFGIEFYGIKCG